MAVEGGPLPFFGDDGDDPFSAVIQPTEDTSASQPQQPASHFEEISQDDVQHTFQGDVSELGPHPTAYQQETPNLEPAHQPLTQDSSYDTAYDQQQYPPGTSQWQEYGQYDPNQAYYQQGYYEQPQESQQQPYEQSYYQDGQGYSYDQEGYAYPQPGEEGYDPNYSYQGYQYDENGEYVQYPQDQNYQYLPDQAYTETQPQELTLEHQTDPDALASAFDNVDISGNEGGFELKHETDSAPEKSADTPFHDQHAPIPAATTAEPTEDQSEPLTASLDELTKVAQTESTTGEASAEPEWFQANGVSEKHAASALLVTQNNYEANIAAERTQGDDSVQTDIAPEWSQDSKMDEATAIPDWLQEHQVAGGLAEEISATETKKQEPPSQMYGDVGIGNEAYTSGPTWPLQEEAPVSENHSNEPIIPSQQQETADVAPADNYGDIGVGNEAYGEYEQADTTATWPVTEEATAESYSQQDAANMYGDAGLGTEQVLSEQQAAMGQDAYQGYYDENGQVVSNHYEQGVSNYYGDAGVGTEVTDQEFAYDAQEAYVGKEAAETAGYQLQSAFEPPAASEGYSQHASAEMYQGSYPEASASGDDTGNNDQSRSQDHQANYYAGPYYQQNAQQTSQPANGGSFQAPLNKPATPDTVADKPCPDPTCTGLNKATAKFCSECGRQLAAVSRTTTPLIGSQSASQSSYDLRKTMSPFPSTTPTQHQEAIPEVETARYASYDGYGQTQQYGYQQDQGYGYYGNMEAEANATPEYGLAYGGVNTSYGMQGYQPVGVSDPLGRDKGHPLVAFGFGGKLVTMFPHKRQTTYTSVSTELVAGSICIDRLREKVGIDHPFIKDCAEFPGPLLADTNKGGAKQKRKDVTKWLDENIETAERELATLGTTDDPSKHQEARLVLLRLFKVLLEHDGTLTGGPKMDESMCRALVPVVKTEDVCSDTAAFTVPADAQSVMTGQPSTIANEESARTLDKLQSYLLRGDRAGAVTYAIQEDMWAHALIISSCVNKDLWKDVVTQFVKRDLSAQLPGSERGKPVYGDKAGLRVLYSLFGGAGAASVSEFLPKTNPVWASKSTRHRDPSGGFVEADTSPEKLAAWRETAALILANKTGKEQDALVALGDLLRQMQWTHAAHACYLLSNQPQAFSGIATRDVRVVLIGVDHQTHPSSFFKDMQSIIHSELWEYAITVKTGPVNAIPHLQAYKLLHAWYLTDLGFLHEAQRYCEAITTIIKNNQKGSLYFHKTLLEGIKELSELLHGSFGSEGAEGASWLTKSISKPNFDSLWGSLEGKLTKFVSGDDLPPSEPESRASTEIVAGPFGSTDIPPARSASATSLRGPFRNNSMTTLDPKRSATPVISTYAGGKYPSSGPGYSYGSEMASVPEFGQTPQTYDSTQYSDYNGGYDASVGSEQPAYGTEGQPEESGFGYVPPHVNKVSSPFGGSNVSASNSTYGSFYPTAGGSTYAPTQSGGGWWGQQESTQETSERAAPVSTQPPASTSYLDDEDDLGFGNSSLKKASKDAAGGSKEEAEDDSSKDKEKEEAAKPAEEAKEQTGGWGLFSLFSRKDGATTPTPKSKKANLGEESSFYYDEKEGRWVNRKAGSSSPAPPSLPPPPKGPASRPATPATSDANSHIGAPPPPRASFGAPPPAMPRTASAPVGPPMSTLGGPPGTPSPLGSVRSSSAISQRKKPMKARYVDVFNQPSQ